MAAAGAAAAGSRGGAGAARRRGAQGARGGRGRRAAPVAGARQPRGAPLPEVRPVPQVVASFAAGAALGPVLDGTHSAHGVLHYAHPSLLRVGAYTLETCWWVPLLFGVAGVILGVGHPLLDDADGSVPDEVASPSPSVVVAAVAAFSADYWLSGELAARAAAVGGPHTASVDAPLATLAVVLWLAFDRTRGGLFLAALTAVCGPLIEVALINLGGLYAYTWPDEGFANTPSWICWVYAAGAPAVGAVGRLVRKELRE